MTAEMWMTLAILGAAIVLFVTEWLRVDVVALGVLVALMLTGLLSPAEALAGFSNPAVLTIAALFIVGGAIMQTGLADQFGRRLLTVAGGSETRLIVFTMGSAALLSAFLSSTGTVAVLLPAIVSLARSAVISPSKLLIPLSFGSLLGGATTLIGTPPNILVSDLLRASGLAPLRFFDYTPIGLLLLAAGLAYMLLVGRHLLPDRQSRTGVQRVDTPEELVALYRLPDNLYRLRVRKGSELVGKTLVESCLRQDFRVSVLEVRRSRSALPRSGIRLGGPLRALQPDALERLPNDDLPLAADDLLLVQGAAGDVSHAAAHWNLGLQPAQAEDERALIDDEIGIAEVLLPPRSSLTGKTLVELHFGSQYRLTVLDITRPEIEELLSLKDTVLQVGDTLLVQGPWQRIVALHDQRRDFVVMGEPDAMHFAPARRKAPLALLILLGMLVVMVSNVLPLAVVSMAAALALVLAGCVSMDEAYGAVDWRSIVLIAGMLPMATALEEVGLVNLLAEAFTAGLGSLGPLVMLAGLFLLTAGLTQVLSNTATTVLVAPIALAAAQNMGVQPYAFAIAVAIAASMAFASPVASPVNTLVMGTGRYTFTDYARIGIPLLLLMLVVTVLFLPLLWPL